MFLIDCLIIESEALETTSFTDCCKNSRVFSTKRLAWKAEILLALTPFVLGVRLLGEHGFIEPYNFLLVVVGLLQPFSHPLKQWCVTTVLGLYWHLGNVDDLLFDQVLLVDEAQAPGLDELVWELSMEECTALLYAPRYPRLESSLCTEVVHVCLFESVRGLLIFIFAIAAPFGLLV